MLALFRRHGSRYLLMGLLGLIALSFVFWGMGSYRGSSSQIRVAGVSLSPKRIATLESRLDTTLPVALRHQQATWLAYLQVTLAERLRGMGFVTSPERIQASLARAGSLEGLEAAAHHAGLTLAQLVEQQGVDVAMRDLMLASKASFIAPANLPSVYAYHYQVHYQRLRFEDVVKSIVPTPEELRGYYLSHPDRYRLPAKIRVRYLQFDTRKVALGLDAIRDLALGNPDDLGAIEVALKRKAKTSPWLVQGQGASLWARHDVEKELFSADVFRDKLVSQLLLLDHQALLFQAFDTQPERTLPQSKATTLEADTQRFLAQQRLRRWAEAPISELPSAWKRLWLDPLHSDWPKALVQAIVFQELGKQQALVVRQGAWVYLAWVEGTRPGEKAPKTLSQGAKLESLEQWSSLSASP